MDVKWTVNNYTQKYIYEGQQRQPEDNLPLLVSPIMFPVKKPAIADRGGQNPKAEAVGTHSAYNDDGRTTPLVMMPPAMPVPSVPVPSYYYGTDDDNNEDNNIREHGICRICLESDHPEDLIAPCLCKGSAKWVHRDCLNNWRTHEQDRAFATCTECQFAYRYEKQPKDDLLDRRTKFCLFVSRDVCLVTVAVQAIIGLMGLLVYAILHTDDTWASLVCPVYATADTSSYYSDYSNQQQDYSGNNNNNNYNDSSAERFGCRHEYVAYYLLGLVGLLIGMGIFGSVFLCSNGCKIPDLSGDPTSSGSNNNENTAATYAADSYQAQDLPQQRSQFYRQQRQRQAARNNSCCADLDPCYCCEICCYPRYGGGYYPYYYYGYYPGYYYGGGDSSSCCCCCCDDGGSSHHAVSNNNAADCDCCPVSTGGSSGTRDDNCNEAGHIILVLLLIFAVVMAIIGLFVGVFVGVIIVQRILQRHLFLLQKRRLVDHFRVADLSRQGAINTTYVDATAATVQGDDDGGFVKATAPTESQLPGPLTPSAPPESEVLNAENERHLRKLGLL